MLLGVGDHEDFTLSSIKQLVELLLPMHLDSMNKLEVYDESLRTLWHQVISCLELSVLSIDTVNDVEKMTLLVHHGMHCGHNKMKLDL
jgi:hypothetical protein